MARAGLCHISNIILLPFTFGLFFALCVIFNLVCKLALLKVTTRPSCLVSRFCWNDITFLLHLSTQEIYCKIG